MSEYVRILHDMVGVHQKGDVVHKSAFFNVDHLIELGAVAEEPEPVVEKLELIPDEVLVDKPVTEEHNVNKDLVVEEVHIGEPVEDLFPKIDELLVVVDSPTVIEPEAHTDGRKLRKKH